VEAGDLLARDRSGQADQMVKGDGKGKEQGSTSKPAKPLSSAESLRQAHALAKSMGGSVVQWKRQSKAPKQSGGGASSK
jgi:hypothetical protein